jgi:hypothetical protein
VSFRGCRFTNHTFAGFPSQPAIIVANGSQNRITVAHSLFEGNDMVVNNSKRQRMSSLIESQGPVNLFRNCFVDNQVGVALVAAFGNHATTAVTAQDNYEEETTFLNREDDRACELSATFPTSVSYETLAPICQVTDADECMAYDDTSRPTNVPTAAALSSPTVTPDSKPPPTPPTVAVVVPAAIASVPTSSPIKDSVEESKEETTTTITTTTTSSAPGTTLSNKISHGVVVALLLSWSPMFFDGIIISGVLLSS